MDKQKKRRTSTALLSASVFHQCFRFSVLGRRTILFICLMWEFSAYHAHICHLLNNDVPTTVKMTFTVILKVLVMMWFQSFSHMVLLSASEYWLALSLRQYCRINKGLGYPSKLSIANQVRFLICEYGRLWASEFSLKNHECSHKGDACCQPNPHRSAWTVFSMKRPFRKAFSMIQAYSFRSFCVSKV